MTWQLLIGKILTTYTDLLLLFHLQISRLVDTVPRDKKEAWGKVHFNDQIQIIQYIFQMFSHYQELCFTNQTGKMKNFVKFRLTLCSDWSKKKFFFAKGSLIVSDIVYTPQLIRHWVFYFSLERFTNTTYCDGGKI